MGEIDVVLRNASTSGVTLAFIQDGHCELAGFSLSPKQALGLLAIYATDPFPRMRGTLQHEIIELHDSPKRAVIQTSKGKSRQKTQSEISSEIFLLVLRCWRMKALPSALET